MFMTCRNPKSMLTTSAGKLICASILFVFSIVFRCYFFLPWKINSAVLTVWVRKIFLFDIKIGFHRPPGRCFKSDFSMEFDEHEKVKAVYYRDDVTKTNELQVRNFSVRINKPLFVFLFHIFRFLKVNCRREGFFYCRFASSYLSRKEEWEEKFKFTVAVALCKIFFCVSQILSKYLLWIYEILLLSHWKSIRHLQWV